jgi:hypothetical protein
MRKTGSLRVLCPYGLPDSRLNIHPNEGADLGMLTLCNSVTLYEGVKGEVRLLNECPRETVEISPKFWEKIGKPSRAVLSLDGDKLSIEPGD